jgi:hypothetical protein
MAYTINKTDGTVLTTVVDGTLNTDTTLQLIGRNYEGYGEAFNENLVKLLENSSNTTAPSNPIKGELWYDATNSVLKVYGGSAFDIPNPSRSAVSTPTTNLSNGVLWFDSGNNDLYVYNGSSFINVLLTDQILDEDNMATDSATRVASQQSIKAYVDSQISTVSSSVSAVDLDFQGDSGGALSVLLDSQTLTVAGGNSITTTGSGQTLTVALDKTIDVNEIASGDSTAVHINDNLDVSGTLFVNNIASADSSGININETALYVNGAKVLTSVSLDPDSVDTVQIVDDAVTRAKLNTEVELIIYDSSGTPVKTLYGAGA